MPQSVTIREGPHFLSKDVQVCFLARLEPNLLFYVSQPKASEPK